MLGGAEADGAGSREAFLAHYHLRGLVWFFVCLRHLAMPLVHDRSGKAATVFSEHSAGHKYLAVVVVAFL